MPKKKSINKPNVNRHGTQEGQQTRVEEYKVIEKYELLEYIEDDISNKIKDIYEDNIWKLKSQFDEMKMYMKELGICGKIAWENGIQYMDIKGKYEALNDVSLSKMNDGGYRSLYTDKKPNSLSTEKAYAKRIAFFTNNFDDFNKYSSDDNLQWIIDNNRLLLYNILKYHNDKGNGISTINKDFKTIVRVLKLLLKEEHELRYKFSALQIAFTDLENASDDLNKIKSIHEVRNFVPYEQLLEKSFELEREYNEEYQSLPIYIRNDSEKHPKELFKKHLILLVMGLYLWDYPSRLEKLKLEYISDENDIEEGNNYILIPDTEMNNTKYRECSDMYFIFNSIVKEHKPLRYQLNSSAMKQLNAKLCNLIKFSLKTYPRRYLFVNIKNGYEKYNYKQITPATVSSWLRTIFDNRNVGIDVFREAFVSYYFPKFNNRERHIMKTRMRTSIDILLRSYLKIYTTNDELVKVKIEPGIDLIEKTNKGINDLSAIYVENIDDNHAYNNANNDIVINKIIDTKDINAIRRDNFKKWYAKDENRERLKKRDTNPSTYARRYVRELNNGKMLIENIQEDTLKKYKIEKNTNGIYVTKI